ncbi:MAG: xanthine dehydrogenase molybdopterin binding subunit [Geminicoccaceae bacterium]|nr:MAG: xanthine dehydrogenase molybdopterin binding subunit [Geminicoccaceae bacterium]
MSRVHQSLAHDSAVQHVTGRARYTDDLPEPKGLLHAAVGLSQCAAGRIMALDLGPVRNSPGVVAVVTAADIPGVNDIGPVFHDEPVLATDRVDYWGQALFAVAATTVEAARRAARLAQVTYAPEPPLLTVDQALAAASFVLPPHTMQKGDVEAALATAPHRLACELRMGGQDHFYLEGQIALVLPQDDGGFLVYSSTQHPSEIQHKVAEVLGLPSAAVTVEVRRMGGGFGGKETQGNLIAVLAALLARQTGRPVKLRLDRDTDMELTGKRHDFKSRFEVGFDDEGRILALDAELAARCGLSADLSAAICDRAMFHTDNAYYLPAARIHAHRCKTHTVSNTAFRGFGGPQGMLGAEFYIDEIARQLGKDPLDVRLSNLYGPGRDTTPYHMQVEDNVLPELMLELEATCRYRQRRQAITAFNAQSPIIKRGLALTPVKFGISFTVTHLNQAGALLHIYQDGSLHLNHGGTEMGQGLFVKVQQIVADVFDVPPAWVHLSPTNTGKVPNTSPTAASSGTDLNGMAAQNAALTLKDRLAAFVAERHQASPEEVRFEQGEVVVRGNRLAFAEVARRAYLARIQLSATGFYKTPKIHYDRDQARGRPFYYFACGAACSEVAVNTATGEHRTTRVDILHDAGRSLNPAIDQGQIEGGFVQGMGWLTSEELWWNEAGRLMTHAPSTYKIPTARDVPHTFHVSLWERGENHEDTIHRSKAVGEPPLMLAISVFLALRDALASLRPHSRPKLDAPATPERILWAAKALREGR